MNTDVNEPDLNQHGEGFRGPQVCVVVGITYRQLDYWARTDLVRPTLQDAAGSGTQRLYSYRDLVELKVVKSLLDAGVSLQTARKAIDYLRSHLGEDLASANLVIDGAKSVLAISDSQIVDLVRQGQGVLNIVPLARVVDSLDAEILALAPRRVPPVVGERRVGERSAGEQQVAPHEAHAVQGG
jgi:DNA-binding transcriptional MerR regulator